MLWRNWEAQGAELREVEFPGFNDAAAISTTMLMAEASAALRDVLNSDGDKLYEPVRLRLEAGLFISAADYLRAQQARSIFDRAARRLLDDVDLLAGPTEPVTAPPLLQQQVLAGEQEIGTVPALTQYTRPYNITGLPGHLSTLRLFLRGPAHRPATGGAPLRRGNGAAGRPRLRAGNGLAHPQAASVAGVANQQGRGLETRRTGKRNEGEG